VNALSAAVRGGILECMQSAIADPEVKAIVLTCGGRTSLPAPTSPNSASRRSSRARRRTGRDGESPKPIIAAISRPALGGGLEVTLAMPITGRDQGARLGLPEVKLGLLPGAGGHPAAAARRRPELAVKMIVGGDPIRRPGARSRTV